MTGRSLPSPHGALGHDPREGASKPFRAERAPISHHQRSALRQRLDCRLPRASRGQRGSGEPWDIRQGAGGDAGAPLPAFVRFSRPPGASGGARASSFEGLDQLQPPPTVAWVVHTHSKRPMDKRRTSAIVMGRWTGSRRKLIEFPRWGKRTGRIIHRPRRRRPAVLAAQKPATTAGCFPRDGCRSAVDSDCSHPPTGSSGLRHRLGPPGRKPPSQPRGKKPVFLAADVRPNDNGHPGRYAEAD